MTTSERVRVERADGIATVTLDRPEKMNALDAPMIEALVAAGEALAVEDDLRAVLLTGAGRGFCAGLDFASFAAMASTGGVGDIAVRTHGDANLFQRVSLVWHDLPVPVIAALHGPVFGGGLQLALGADIRVAAPDARVSVMEMKWGLIPDMGGMVLLPRLVRGDMMRRLIYTAEELDGRAAREAGLVTELAEDPLARAREIAEAIAARSPQAIRRAKRLLAETEGADRPAALMAESVAQAALIGTPEQMEAVAAGLARRPARFG